MGKRILIADDSTSVRKLVVFTLQEAGYEVVEAVDGRDALEKTRSIPIDMVITDLNMPNLDGITFTREARELPASRFIPIIILTTEAQPEKKQEGKEAGATGWIVKPFLPDQLIAVVRKVLK